MLVNDILPGIALVEDLSVAKRSSIVGENIVGTAFAVDVRGYFLTAKHVITGVHAHDFGLRTTFAALPGAGYAMKTIPVQAVYPHPQLDVAVLAVPSVCAHGRINLHFETEVVAIGTDVLLVGYGAGTDLVFCDDILGPGSPKSFSPVAFNGMICARVPHDVRPVELLVYDCTTFAGNSGAPVISVKSGKIAGLHLRGYENHIGYGVPIDRCLTFMEAIATIHEPRRSQYNHIRMKY